MPEVPCAIRLFKTIVPGARLSASGCRTPLGRLRPWTTEPGQRTSVCTSNAARDLNVLTAVRGVEVTRNRCPLRNSSFDSPTPAAMSVSTGTLILSILVIKLRSAPGLRVPVTVPR